MTSTSCVCACVCFNLVNTAETHLKNRTHGVSCGSPEVGAELIESLQVSLRGNGSKCVLGNDV